MARPHARNIGSPSDLFLSIGLCQVFAASYFFSNTTDPKTWRVGGKVGDDGDARDLWTRSKTAATARSPASTSTSTEAPYLPPIIMDEQKEEQQQQQQQ